MPEDRRKTGVRRPPDVPGALPGLLSGFVAYLVRRVHARLSASTAEQDADARDYLVLDALATRDWLSQLELADRLGINRTLMVAFVGALERRGELAGTRNPSNRRSHVLSLTVQGLRTLAVRRCAVAERERRLTAALTPAEHIRLEALLSRLLPGAEPLLARRQEYLVAQVHHRLRRLGDEKLAGTGLRVRYYGPLRGLEDLGPCVQQQLAAHLAITGPAASQLVRELVERGSVRRGRTLTTAAAMRWSSRRRGAGTWRCWRTPCTCWSRRSPDFSVRVARRNYALSCSVCWTPPHTRRSDPPEQP